MSKESESPEKAALATVLNYLKTKNLKETAEVLKKELGLATSDGGLETLPSSSGSLHSSAGGHSGTEPEKYEESYVSSQAAPSSPSSMADVQLKGLAPDQSSSSSDDNSSDDETQQDNSTMEISSGNFLPPPPPPPPSRRPGSLLDLHVNSAQPDCHQDKEAPSPSSTRTQLVFTAKPSLTHSPSPVDRSTSLLQAKSFLPPPLIPSSKPATFYDIVSSSSSSSAQSPIKTTPTAVQGEAVTAPSLNSATTSVAAQLPVNTTQFIYHLASAAQPVGGIRQSVLTPILTLLPNAQGLMASRQVVGAAIPQPVILSPPAQALSMPIASTSSAAAAAAAASLMTGYSKVVNGAAAAATTIPSPQQKTLLEHTLGLSHHQSRVLSTEPTTGQQTLKSPVGDVVTSTARNSSPPRTLASIPLSEMTPQYTELKAFAEEFKNKRIRLGFTQGAVGQSLADKGYSNFAQSTISRFEQMQLSPTNAAAIKLVLEKWLQETENPEAAHSPSSSSPVLASRKRKRRAVFTPQTKSTLETYFKQNPRPNRHVIESVAQELELLPEEVRVWFCNKRQKEKQGTGCGGGVQLPYKYTYERESSVSLSSSGANSPSSLYDSSFYPKRNTPSPQRNATPFTIEELSKSSSTATRTVSSPVCIANPFTTSPQGVVMALTTPRISLGAQPVAPPTRVVLPQLQVSQTTA